MNQRFGLLYATRRPHCIAGAVEMWRARARWPAEAHWMLGLDDDDAESQGEASRLGLPFVVVGPPHNSVRAWNLAAERLMQTGRLSALGSDALVAISDDWVPPHSWDQALRSVIPEDPDYVLHVHDGGEGALCTLPVVGTARYQRFGYFYWPEYESMFCDTELTARAFLDGSLVDARHILFEHMHPVNQKRPSDAVDAAHANQERWDRGKAIFQRRIIAGFAPGKNPHDLPPTKLDQYLASLMVTKDDLCLDAVVGRLLADGVRNFAFNVPTRHWDGSIVSESDVQEVVAVAARLIDLGAWYVRVFRDSLAPFESAFCTRGDVETRYRNFCLARLRRLGFVRQLIVDGDELYLPGALAALDWSVRWFSPPTAAMLGVPFAGAPAVAVEGATDRILGYIGPADHWRSVRSPTQPTLDIPHVGVLHFSAVRRTQAELAAKMRKSGHYDDPDYDFEGWLKRAPSLAPGDKNVHMYRDGSLWPEARALTDSEWAAIPPGLHHLFWGGQHVQPK